MLFVSVCNNGLLPLPCPDSLYTVLGMTEAGLLVDQSS